MVRLISENDTLQEVIQNYYAEKFLLRNEEKPITWIYNSAVQQYIYRTMYQIDLFTNKRYHSVVPVAECKDPLKKIVGPDSNIDLTNCKRAFEKSTSR